MSDARNEVSLTSRRTTEAVWRGVAAAATALTVVLLASVLVSVVGRGSRGLSMTTLTELPRPTGVAGGGVANAIWGTLLLMGLASAIALPVGLLAGIHLAENREGKLVRMARVSADAKTIPGR